VPAHATSSRRNYAARRPQDSVLYQVVASELEGFLADAQCAGHPVPLFIERTFRDYLSCGVPEHGFVRVHCPRCRHDRIVAFSCKRRGLCPSCAGRRMADTAADLVEHVLPHVGVRQWVLTLPFALRYRLACDRALLAPVLRGFLDAVFASQRRRIRARYGVPGAGCGAVTFVQRFGGALNLNVHLHTLVLEGGYEMLPGARGVRFLALGKPSDEDVREILADAIDRIGRRLRRAGVSLDTDLSLSDELARKNPLLAAMYAASVESRVPSGPLAGRPTMRLGAGSRSAADVDTPPLLCAVGYGISLHAGVFIPATDRERLERVCRYMGRPPLAMERLCRLEDGRISYRMRHPWRDGSTHVVMSPRELMGRLAAQIPPPRQHQVRYHGILAPSAAWRDQVVPGPAVSALSGASRRGEGSAAHRKRCSPRYRPWAALLRRVFKVDVLECPRCGGRTTVFGAHAVEARGGICLPQAKPEGRAPPALRVVPVVEA
jgi:ribosomal protein S27E